VVAVSCDGSICICSVAVSWDGGIGGICARAVLCNGGISVRYLCILVIVILSYCTNFFYYNVVLLLLWLKKNTNNIARLIVCVTPVSVHLCFMMYSSSLGYYYRIANIVSVFSVLFLLCNHCVDKQKQHPDRTAVLPWQHVVCVRAAAVCVLHGWAGSRVLNATPPAIVFRTFEAPVPASWSVLFFERS
jgi:hypothetical protein